MKKVKIKSENAITLIALIITIIVLLILAGVTINLTLGENGIFRVAEQAARNYKDAENKELTELGNFNNLINNKINGIGQSGNIGETKVTGITLSKTNASVAVNGTEEIIATIIPENANNKNIKWTSSDETIATVENGKITAKKEGTVTITATAQDGSGISATCTVTVNLSLASKAKPGDYVKYDGGNGYTGLWQVLYNDETYGLQIISADVVNEEKLFTLGGSTEAEAKASYNGAVDTLNTECRKYVNTKYATSGRCVGSNPLSPDDEITETFILPFKYNNTTESGCKVADTNYETDYNAMKAATHQNTAGIHKVSSDYWLASRNMKSYSGAAYFYVRFVITSGVAGGPYLWYVESADGDSLPTSHSSGLRPVVTLYSDIQTCVGDGSEGSAFELVAK